MLAPISARCKQDRRPSCVESRRHPDTAEIVRQLISCKFPNRFTHKVQAGGMVSAFHHHVELLSIPMAAPDALFDALRIPGQVVIDDQ